MSSLWKKKETALFPVIPFVTLCFYQIKDSFTYKNKPCKNVQDSYFIYLFLFLFVKKKMVGISVSLVVIPLLSVYWPIKTCFRIYTAPLLICDQTPDYSVNKQKTEKMVRQFVLVLPFLSAGQCSSFAKNYTVACYNYSPLLYVRREVVPMSARFLNNFYILKKQVFYTYVTLKYNK